MSIDEERTWTHAAFWTKGNGTVACGSNVSARSTPHKARVTCPRCLVALRQGYWPEGRGACPDCSCRPWEGHKATCVLVKRYGLPVRQPYDPRVVPQDVLDYAAEIGVPDDWRKS